MERATDTESLERGKQALIALHHGRWQGTESTGVFRAPNFLEFHNSIMRKLLDRQALELVWISVRGEPVAALYEQGRVSHVGSFPELEDELCSAIGEGKKSPDRLDALVWAVSDLMLRRRAEPRIRIL